MRRHFGNVEFPEEHVRLGRAGYYGLISYFDEKIGTLLQALDDTGKALALAGTGDVDELLFRL